MTKKQNTFLGMDFTNGYTTRYIRIPDPFTIENHYVRLWQYIVSATPFTKTTTLRYQIGNTDLVLIGNTVSHLHEIHEKSEWVRLELYHAQAGKYSGDVIFKKASLKKAEKLMKVPSSVIYPYG